MKASGTSLVEHFSRLRSLTGPAIDSARVILYGSGGTLTTIVSSTSARGITNFTIPTAEGEKYEEFGPIATDFQRLLNVLVASKGGDIKFSIGQKIAVSGVAGRFMLSADALDLEQTRPIMRDATKEEYKPVLTLKPGIMRVLTELISSLAVGDVKGTAFRLIIHTKPGSASIVVGYNSAIGVLDIQDKDITTECDIETVSKSIPQAIRAIGQSTKMSNLTIGLGEKVARLANDSCIMIIGYKKTEKAAGIAQIEKLKKLMKTCLSDISVPVDGLSVALGNANMMSNKTLQLPLAFKKEGITLGVSTASGSFETKINGTNYELNGKETDVKCIANVFSRMLRCIASASGEDKAKIRVYSVNDKSFYIDMQGPVVGEKARVSYTFKMVKNN